MLWSGFSSRYHEYFFFKSLNFLQGQIKMNKLNQVLVWPPFAFKIKPVVLSTLEHNFSDTCRYLSMFFQASWRTCHSSSVDSGCLSVFCLFMWSKTDSMMLGWGLCGDHLPIGHHWVSMNKQQSNHLTTTITLHDIMNATVPVVYLHYR